MSLLVSRVSSLVLHIKAKAVIKCFTTEVFRYVTIQHVAVRS